MSIVVLDHSDFNRKIREEKCYKSNEGKNAKVCSRKVNSWIILDGA